MSKSSIILFIPSLGRGGAERVFVNLSNEWINKYNIILLHQYGDNFLAEFLNKDVQKVKISKNFLLACAQFYRLVKKEKPLFVLSCLNIPNIINGLVSKLFFMKHRVVLRQASPLKNIKNHRLVFFLLKWSYKLSDLIICNSETTKKTVLDVNKKLNTVVISNPVLSDELQINGNNYENINPSILQKKYILAVGRLEPVKNFEFLIYAFSKLRNENLYLVILGEGSERKKLEHLIISNNLKDKVFLLGAVKNPYVYYKNASLFVSTSLWEGFGNVYIEAAYFGLPIVTTKSGAAEEILNAGEFGYLVESNNHISLISQIKKALINPKDRLIPFSDLEKYKVEFISKKYIEVILEEECFLN